jgi:capsular polysaccharide biosynthesis protein
LRNQISEARWALGALHRGKRVLALAALVGLVAGTVYAVAQPPPRTSTTLVLLPTPARAESSSSDVDTQVQIALSSSVLERAGRTVAPALSARSVKKMVAVRAPTPQLLQIEATSTKAAEARAVSQAVADSYVGYVTNTAREVTDAALADLTIRKDDLTQHIQQLQDEIAASAKRQRAINPESALGRKEAQVLAQLRSQQADLVVQLDKVKDKIATGGDVGSIAGAGTTVVQNATVATGLPTVLRLVLWALLGAIAVAILAAVALLVAARRDPRIRLRDEIADAVGSPVLGALRSRPQHSVAGWPTLLETYEATAVESWAFRQVLRGVLPDDRKRQLRVAGTIDHPQSLSMLSLADDEAGLAMAPQLAAFAASSGITTRLLTAIGHESAASLWAASEIDRDAPLRPGLYVGDVPDGTTIDLSIHIIVLDRGQPSLGDATVTEATVLAVAAGTATEQELARTAIAVDNAGRCIDGILVADPDPTDRTSGRHTMDDRSRRPSLPTKLTGIPSSGAAAGAVARSRS